MREKIENILDLFGWFLDNINGVLFYISPFIIFLWVIFGIRVEDYTTTCEVIDRYEERDSSMNVSLTMLLNTPIYGSHDEYKIVVIFEEKEYDIEVGEKVFRNIQVGDCVECEITKTYGKITGELLDKKIELATDQS